MLHLKATTLIMVNSEQLNFDEPKETCVRMDLCSDENILDLLREEQPLELGDIIEEVNSNPRSNWVAGVNDKFYGASLKEIKSLMGTVVDPDWTIKIAPREGFSEISDSVPDSFDARTNWPECESVINNVRDQANCGSCWAFGTTEALNDRACIASSGSMTTLYSTSDTTACCNGTKCFSFGCNGG